MDNFTFYAPTYFDFGKGAEKHVADLIKKFGGHKVLLHYGGGSIKKSGLYDTVISVLKESGLEFCELGGVKPNPRSGLVYEGIELCKKEKVDFILAVGGGSTIDSSKAIAAGTLYDGDFMDFYQGKASVEKALPIGTILTIAAAGSEGSPNTVITDEKTMVKKGTTITNSIRLLKLDDAVQDMLVAECITSGHARALLALDDKSLQYEIANKILDEKLSVRETEKLIKQVKNGTYGKKTVKKKVFDNQEIYTSYEEKMKQSVGSKVTINRKDNSKGKIEIEYYSNDELDRIVSYLTK